MLSVAHAAGVKVRSERLDWMYQGGVGARQEADQRLNSNAEAKLQPAADQLAGQDRGRVDKVTELPSFYAEDTPASANETWQRLHADPLFAIKQQELASRRSILSNPVKMEAIKSQVSKVRQEYGKDSRDRKRASSREDKNYSRRGRREESNRERERERYEEFERKDRRRVHRYEENYSNRPHERPSYHRDTAEHRTQRRRSGHSRSRSPARDKYGMTYADHVPEEVRNSDRSQIAEATRRRLEEGRRKQEEEERSVSRDRGWKKHHRDYRPGRLTEEDRRRRLEQMESAANDYEAQRKGRIAEQIYQESKEEAQQRDRREDGTSKFLQTATRDAYAQRGEVADAVGRRRAFSQARDDEGRGFTHRGR